MLYGIYSVRILSVSYSGNMSGDPMARTWESHYVLVTGPLIQVRFLSRSLTLIEGSSSLKRDQRY